MVRRQFRNLSVKRYEALLAGDPSTAFNCYCEAFKRWKEYMKNQNKPMDQCKYINGTKEYCKIFLDKAKEELVTGEVFCALSSLHGSLQAPFETPQDKILHQHLKDKLVLKKSKLNSENPQISMKTAKPSNPIESSEGSSIMIAEMENSFKKVQNIDLLITRYSTMNYRLLMKSITRKSYEKVPMQQWI